MERALSYLYVAAALALTVYGHVMLKARALVHTARAATDQTHSFLISMFLDIWVLSGFASAVVAAGFWMLAIRNSDLSLLYPFMALTFVFVPLLAVLLLGEKVTALQVVGFVMIVGGVSLASMAR
jgi:drug/metabolite transporter (DMT)-like permease